jgi:guanylate kinase
VKVVNNTVAEAAEEVVDLIKTRGNSGSSR